MANYTFNPAPPREALNYFRAKKLKPSFDYRDVWREEHASAFTVAKAMQIDILETIRDELDRSLAQGIPYEEFKKDLIPTLQKLGWWGKSEEVDPATGETQEVVLGTPRRLKTIYQVNMRTARSAGQWQRAQRTKRSHQYLLYELGPSKEHRQEHLRWNGLLLPVDDPFWSTHMPTNGYGCKCRVRQVSRREYERLVKTGKYLTKAPQVKTREWVNKRTGETLQVPEGIDPGFDTNPGAVAREHHTAQIFANKVKSARPEVGATAMRSATEFVRDGLESNYQSWTSDLIQGKRRATGERQLLSAVSAKAIREMGKSGIQLDTAAVTLLDKRARQFVESRAVPEAEIVNLVKHLAAPKAVLLDTEKQLMIYVLEKGGSGFRQVEISLAESGSTQQAGKRRTIKTNEIRTIAPAKLSEIRGAVNAGELQLIDGKL